MSVSVKVSENTYVKLKWLKNRYEAVDGKDLSWEEFLGTVMEDNLFMLAVKFRKKNPQIDWDSITSFLLGSYYSVDEILTEERKNVLETSKK